MRAYAIKTGVTILWTKKYFEIRIRLLRYVAPHNVRRCFHNDSCSASVRNMHALLQENNCIYIVALFEEISSRNNKSERNENIFIRIFRSPHVECIKNPHSVTKLRLFNFENGYALTFVMHIYSKIRRCLGIYFKIHLNFLRTIKSDDKYPINSVIKIP